jgi:hypothetical protein
MTALNALLDIIARKQQLFQSFALKDTIALSINLRQIYVMLALMEQM